MSAPATNRTLARGRNAPTRGGFIQGSDLACARGLDQLDALPQRAPSMEVKDFPAEAKILRTTTSALRGVPLPAASSALHERLLRELKGAASIASTLDRLYSAYARHSATAFKAGLTQLDAQGPTMDALHQTYASQGVSLCTDFFDTSSAADGSLKA